jgi:50S ribosomal protein L16 3-hydroxylase
MDARQFLRDYWQKRPLLIRAAFPAAGPLCNRADLFALARNPDVESRLVLERAGDYPWQVQHGPFSAARMRRLPASRWSLLVQGVNFHWPRAAALLEEFSFIPNWRVDDLMVSYAVDKGGVGPHLDSYDVFLLQASGRRRWRISGRHYGESDLVPGLDLRILGNFRPSREWLLEPGDMLYLPPGVAHHGIAVGESITCSIGFRAPSSSELLGALLDSEGIKESRIEDPGLLLQAHAGELTARQRRQLRQLLRDAVPDDAALDHWLGRELTTLPPSVPAPAPGRVPAAPAFLARLKRGQGLIRTTPSRTVFFRAPRGRIHLFINGAEFELPARSAALAARITGPGPFHWLGAGKAASRQEGALLLRLYHSGLLQFVD